MISGKLYEIIIWQYQEQNRYQQRNTIREQGLKYELFYKLFIGRSKYLSNDYLTESIQGLGNGKINEIDPGQY